MTLWIFGDSFASSQHEQSWVSMVAHGHTMVNRALNGVSEYRILCSVRESRFAVGDDVIICHTNPDRIFLPDHIDYPSRGLDTHRRCDLVLGDAMRKGRRWRKLSRMYFEYFYDTTHQRAMVDLMCDSMAKQVRGSGARLLNLSGFPAHRDDILSFHETAMLHPGPINHMDEIGNAEVAAMIGERL